MITYVNIDKYQLNSDPEKQAMYVRLGLTNLSKYNIHVRPLHNLLMFVNNVDIGRL